MTQNQKGFSRISGGRSGSSIDPGPHIAEVMANEDKKYAGRLKVYIPMYGGDKTNPTSWYTVRYASPFYGISIPQNSAAQSPQPSTAQPASQAAGTGSMADARAADRNSVPGYSATSAPAAPSATLNPLTSLSQQLSGAGGVLGSLGSTLGAAGSVAGAAGLLNNAATSLAGASSLLGGLGAGVAGAAPAQQQTITSYGMWMIPPDIGVEVLVVFVDGNPDLGFWFACLPTFSHGMIPAIGADDGKTPKAEFNPDDVFGVADIKSIQRSPYEPLVQALTTQGIQQDPLRGPITTSSFRESPSNVFGFSSKAGHTFAMDDGGQDGKSKLIRLRTAGGNQITMHDDSGMIYMINSQGTGWVEISPSGQIDVYGAAGINMATTGDINLHADKNVTIHAGQNLKLIGMQTTKLQGTTELQMVGKKTKIEGIDSLHLHSCTEILITSFSDIFVKAYNFLILNGKCFQWNTTPPKEAEQTTPDQPQTKGSYQTTVLRAPTKEPYAEHDNGSAGGAAGSMPAASSLLGSGPSASLATGMAAQRTIANGQAVTPNGLVGKSV